MEEKKNITNDDQKIESLYTDARAIIESARANAVRSVDFCRVQMYWHLGKRILEEEQQGKARADYGTYLIRNLAKAIEPDYGSGFGVRQLEQARQFYRIYPIANTLRSQLNWSQYRRLIQIDDRLNDSYSAIGFANETNAVVIGKAEGTFAKSSSTLEEIEARWYTRAEVRELLKTERFAARTQAYCYLWSREEQT